MGAVQIRKGKARPFWFRHPWVFSGAVDRVRGNPGDGDVVDVLDADQSFIGRGLYNARSQIRVRVLTHDADETIDDAFFIARLDRAVALRRDILRLDAQGTDGYRLVHGEGDGLSGVIVDRFRDHFVIQFSALGVKQREGLFLDYLRERFDPASIYENANFPYREAEGIEDEGGVRHGEASNEVAFSENGIDYVTDLEKGQKTGFYFDQRDNRRAVGSLARGARVLDAFCYSGSFALNAIRGGAEQVVGVDSSKKAIALARRHAAMNDADAIEFVDADANAYLRDVADANRTFDVVLLDPPKYAVAKKDQQNAIHRYRELNAAGMRAVEPGGILVTSSCSHHVSNADFEALLNEAAKQAGRFVQFLQCRGQSTDHPVSSACPEGRYLKCFVIRVS